MINYVQVSHIGNVRSINEDSVQVCNTDSGYTLGIVADGMGGHQAGEKASQFAVETILADLSALEKGMSSEALQAALSDAILRANDVIYHEAANNEQYHNMGTTAVVLLMNGTQGWIGHVGDSRAYKVAECKAIQLTEDHTLVNELYKNGQITEAELDTHPRRNVLTKAVGTDIEVTVDVDSVTLGPQEVLFLCSDGLTNMVSNQHLGQIVGMQEVTLAERADRLLQLALLAGGDDNITIALFELQNDVVLASVKEWDS
ncbi:Stp1/IreP family PP2C-type Ser/Thr phosphatase [Paenibacillus crassostreae]|uniref:Serine/threonine protein phosphatase n=1 Tax=Paenibacillus crassostreae TaxID=1763538 RepID=A0A167C806_9BACL|nr:Stp1/IreP family PP2C-type Ser/Thr phosphatase [Paenibacillus crassostreae]AOZ91529.1 serine/threonine protein phosphatase [Paenibacillus crassostreae]OAB72896.1 serine/threonine protein phosphatase [Paenibacillus crassostreae]